MEVSKLPNRIEREKISQIQIAKEAGLKYSEIMSMLGIGKNTIIRYLNPETRRKHNEAHRQRYLHNKQNILKQQKQYVQTHRELVNERVRRYYSCWDGFGKKTYWDIVKEHHHIPYTPAEFRQWLALQPKSCRLCGLSLDLKETIRKRRPTIDHIIAIKNGGGGELSNLQLLCRKCNEIKGCYKMEEIFETIEKWRTMQVGTN